MSLYIDEATKQRLAPRPVAPPQPQPVPQGFQQDAVDQAASGWGMPPSQPFDYFDQQQVTSAPTGAWGDNAPSAPPLDTLGRVWGIANTSLAPEDSNPFLQEALRPINYVGAGGGFAGLARGALGGIGGRLGAEYAPQLLPAGAPDWQRTAASVAGGLVGGGIGGLSPEIAQGGKRLLGAADRVLNPGELPRIEYGRTPTSDSLFTAGPNGEVVGPTGNVAELRLGREPVMGEDVNAGLRRTAYGRAQQEQLAAEEQAAFRDAGERAISGAVPDGGTPSMGGGSGASDAEFARLTAQAEAEKAATGAVSAETHDALMNLLGERIGATPTAEQAAAREAFYRDPANLGGGQGLTPEAQQATTDLVKRADQRNVITDALAAAREPDPFARFETPNPDALPEPNRTQPPPGYLERFRQPPAGGAEVPGSQPPIVPKGGFPRSNVTPEEAFKGNGDYEPFPPLPSAVSGSVGVSETMKPTLLEQAADVANAPRTLLTSFDLSAPFRQGAMLIGHPREFFGAMKPMVQSFASSDVAHAVDEAIHASPYATVKDQAGLYLAPLDYTGPLALREEAFMSRTVGRLPGVEGSQRAYTTFLNKVRSDTFDQFWGNLPSEAQTPANAARYARFINAATGRGTLPNALADFAPTLNAAFFSPRYFISRFESNGMGALAIGDLAKSAVTMQALDPVSKAIAVDVLKFYATGLTALGLAKMAGASVEADPRSSDFGKIRVGDTRYDVWAGNQQIARFIAQESSGERKNLSSGNIQPAARNTTVLNFMRSKLAPVPGLMWDTLKGTTPTGEKMDATPATLKRQLWNSFVPLVAQDIVDGVQNDGAVGGIKALPTILGVGTQTFAPTTPKGSSKGGIPKIALPKTTLPKLALPKIAKP